MKYDQVMKWSICFNEEGQLMRRCVNKTTIDCVTTFDVATSVFYLYVDNKLFSMRKSYQFDGNLQSEAERLFQSTVFNLLRCPTCDCIYEKTTTMVCPSCKPGIYTMSMRSHEQQVNQVNQVYSQQEEAYEEDHTQEYIQAFLTGIAKGLSGASDEKADKSVPSLISGLLSAFTNQKEGNVENGIPPVVSSFLDSLTNQCEKENENKSCPITDAKIDGSGFDIEKLKQYAREKLECYNAGTQELKPEHFKCLFQGMTNKDNSGLNVDDIKKFAHGMVKNDEEKEKIDKCFEIADLVFNAFTSEYKKEETDAKTIPVTGPSPTESTTTDPTESTTTDPTESTNTDPTESTNTDPTEDTTESPNDVSGKINDFANMFTKTMEASDGVNADNIGSLIGNVLGNFTDISPERKTAIESISRDAMNQFTQNPSAINYNDLMTKFAENVQKNLY